MVRGSIRNLVNATARTATWSGNTFQVAAVGQGEHAGNLTFTGNHIYLHQNAADSVTLEGQNVKFDGNDVHTVGNYADPSGWGSIGADVYATTPTTPATSRSRTTRSSVPLMGITASYWRALVLRFLGTRSLPPAPQPACTWRLLERASPANTFQMGSGTGILLYAPPVDAATVTGNKLNGTGRVGIYVRTPPARAAGGGDEVKRSPSATGIYNNTITGFTIPLDAPSARLGPTNILRKNLR